MLNKLLYLYMFIMVFALFAAVASLAGAFSKVIPRWGQYLYR